MNEEYNTNKNCLNILTAPDAEAAGIGDLLRPIPIPIEKLSKNLEEFTNKLGKLLPATPRLRDYELSEITVSVNITAGGELQLIGMVRAKGEAQGGLTLKFSKLNR